MLSSLENKDHSAGSVAWVVLVAAFGGFLFGFDIAVINGAVQPIQAAFGLGEVTLGFVVSAALLGAMVGAWIGGPLVDRLGRVRSMQIAAILFFASSIASGVAVGAVDFVFYRLIGGVGVGLASVIAPAYIAEVSPTRMRGRLGSMWQMAITLGIFASAVSNAFVSNLAGGSAEEFWLGLDAWRWMLIFEAVPALIYGLLALSIPESPRYLIARGQDARARTVLTEIVGITDPSSLQSKVQEIRETINLETRQRLRDLLASGKVMPIVWVGIGLAVFQQFVGINVIFFYSDTLWQSVGIPEDQSLLIQVLSTSVNVLFTVVGIIVVDKVGRRIPLIIGSAGMTLALAVLAVAFSQAQIADATDESAVALPEPWNLIALIAANVFVAFFAATWGPFMWVLLGEMFPNRIRAVAMGVAAAFNWLANFLVTTLFPAMADLSLVFAYGFYAAVALISLGFVVKWVPETKDRELEDMQEGAYRR